MYIGILENTGINVPDEEAFDYAKNHLDEMSEEDKKQFTEFYFSGNFIYKEELINV